MNDSQSSTSEVQPKAPRLLVRKPEAWRARGAFERHYYPGLQIACFVATLWFALLGGSAQAAVFCVNSVSSLQSALTTAAGNGQGDTINVVAGTYALTTPLTANVSDGLSLGIVGSWNAGCGVRGTGATVLDGQQQTAVIDISAQGSSAPGLGIAFLTITGGYQDLNGSHAGAGAALYTAGPVNVENCTFYANRHDGSFGGGLHAYAGPGSTLTVRNNVFLANVSSGASAASLYANGGPAHVYGNTLVFNQLTGASVVGGILAAGPGAYLFANNLFWLNTGGDLFNAAGLGNGSLALYNNDIGSLLGSTTATGSGNFNRDPQFAPGFLNLRLSSSSPLINAGTLAATGGIGDYDVSGAQRLQGAGVDIGAYESDVLLFNGFELP
jgi:hypothetical protein